MLDCKQQILSTIPDSNCCSLTFFNILVFSCAQINKNFSNLVINSQPFVIEKAIKIIKNFYPNIEVSCWDNFLSLKGNIRELLIDINYQNDLNLTLFPSDCDRLTILKSLFVTSGKFYYTQDSNKNSKGYNLEFVLKDETSANIVLELLKEREINLRKIKRQQNYVVYTKNSNTISDLFVLLGASYTSLDIQNSLTMREMRNAANRQNNCFEFNLDKTLNASALQLEAINYIIDNFSIDYFDENLQEVALVRIANPDATLNELRMLMNNKISRAGIKYRLDKIIEMYQKLKKE